MTLRTTLLACAFAIAAVQPAWTQPAAPPAAPQRQNDAWYGEQLTELATVLGGSHYLRILCQGRDDQRWRQYMQGVIAREPAYRSRLVDAFNDGYRNEETRFEECDRTASQMEAELRAQGLRIADALRARHTN